MAVRELAISFDEELAKEVAEAAEQDAEGNVSAWLARAARERLRRAAARRLLDELVAEHGPITDDEREQVRRQWPQD
jgi:hypothetical protein